MKRQIGAFSSVHGCASFLTTEEWLFFQTSHAWSSISVYDRDDTLIINTSTALEETAGIALGASESRPTKLEYLNRTFSILGPTSD